MMNRGSSSSPLNPRGSGSRAITRGGRVTSYHGTGADNPVDPQLPGGASASQSGATTGHCPGIGNWHGNQVVDFADRHLYGLC